MIEYKGYSGLVEVDVEDGVISGRILGIRDVVTFEGDTVPEAIQAFHDSVDDYLDFCAERGVAPDKPYSGKFIVRIRPELHRVLAIGAELSRISLNAYVEQLLMDSPALEGVLAPSRIEAAQIEKRKKLRAQRAAETATGETKSTPPVRS